MASLLSQVMTKVNDLNENLSTKLDSSKAIEDAGDIYNYGVQWIIREIGGKNQTDDFQLLPVTSKLVQALSMEEIQHGHELKYHISKTCRVFAECYAWKICLEKDVIRTETKEKLIQSLNTVLGTLPSRQVATRYEIRCAREAIKLIDTNESLIARYGLGIYSLIKDQDLIAGLNTVRQVYKDMLSTSTIDVLKLNWISKAVENKEAGYNLISFYEEGQNYKQVQRVAFCVLEGLMALFMQALSAQKREEEKLFLVGKDTNNNQTTISSPIGKTNTTIVITKPGLLTFATIQKCKSVQEILKKLEEKLKKTYSNFTTDGKAVAKTFELVARMDPYWRVRYRAIEHLKTILKQNDLSSESREKILKTLSECIIAEKHPQVLQILEEIHGMLKQDSSWIKYLGEKKTTLQNSKNQLQSLNTQNKQLSVQKNSKPRRKFLEGNEEGYDSPDETTTPTEVKELTTEELELQKYELQIQEQKLAFFFGGVA